ncbi:pyridoxal-phosphate dependent enzyme [Allokutzneria albata]|uniref:Cysteine synthase A n=1 Tax=Allokutzneria albata TaxID=211114 RepID=A0A1G9VC54_ALLAB|nr:pyridoxal-phosphate dependent enzyme [Allokutzneria albata]SDM69784.1 cysteine synthase A [Allokutzneria albata]
MHDHIADALSVPRLVRLADNVVLVRFETMKIYSALAAVRWLLDNGIVRRGQTLLDSSSGIYAVSLALACHRYGMRCHIVASTTVDQTVRAQLDILGATVEQVPPSTDLRQDQDRRVARVMELLAERHDVHWMRQYHDRIHYLGYAEVAEQVTEELAGAGLGGRPLAVVGGVGSGASTGGLTTYLRRADDTVRLIGVQPFGSVTFGSEAHSDPEAIIAGIGSAIEFGNVRHELYDRMHWLGFTNAMAGSVALLREHAVFAGLSTGAAHLVGRWEAERDPRRVHLVIAADTGHRYVERVFARHAEAADVRDLAPTEITDPADLVMPWSAMSWNRRSWSRGALTSSGAAR